MHERRPEHRLDRSPLHRSGALSRCGNVIRLIHTGPMKARTARSLAAEAKFHEILASVGALSLEPVWTGTLKPHLIRCAEGHVVDPRPDNVLQGHSPCRTCAGRDSVATEARFRAVLAEAGAELLDPWTDSHKPHRVRCAFGHITPRLPTNMLQGHLLCNACIGHDSVNGWAKFREGLTRWGATLLEEAWLGSKVRHRTLCAEGHKCWPRPSDLLGGHNPCLTCVGQDPATNRARFVETLAQFGAVLLEPGWLGTNKPHLIRCAAGHETDPRPSDVYQGVGVCRRCAGNQRDVFYVVTDPVQHVVKFGVTSGNPAARLRDHRRDGFTIVERLHTDLAESLALKLEQAVRAALHLAKAKPVRGREYHDASVAALVLDVVDNYPLTPTDGQAA